MRILDTNRTANAAPRRPGIRALSAMPMAALAGLLFAAAPATHAAPIPSIEARPHAFPAWCVPAGPFHKPHHPGAEGPRRGGFGRRKPHFPGGPGSQAPLPSVPEPGSLVLLGAGVLGLWALRPTLRRKKD